MYKSNPKSLATLSSNEFKTGLVSQQLARIKSGVIAIEYANESVRALNHIFKLKYNISLNLALTSSGKFASKNFSNSNTFEFHIKIKQFYQTRIVGILNLITGLDDLFSAEVITTNDAVESLSETIEVTRPDEDSNFIIFLEHLQEYEKPQPLSSLPAGILDCLRKFDRENIHSYDIRIISSANSLHIVARIFDTLLYHFSKRLFKCDRILFEQHPQYQTTLSRIYATPFMYIVVPQNIYI